MLLKSITLLFTILSSPRGVAYYFVWRSSDLQTPYRYYVAKDSVLLFTAQPQAPALPSPFAPQKLRLFRE
jgi:hypothetical protein